MPSLSIVKRLGAKYVLALALVPFAMAQTETVLYNFSGPDGAYPESGVVADDAGNLYGVTFNGGAAGLGVVYKLDPNGNETVLHSFLGGEDGYSPSDEPLLDRKGNLYGTTSFGGAADLGIVFEIDAGGQFTVLHSFTGGSDGTYPSSGLFRGADGNLYGTTDYGGVADKGVVYRLDTDGNESVFHSFMGPDGDTPVGGVIRDPNGDFFGATFFGGRADGGLVYKLDSYGNDTVLHTFTGRQYGWSPLGELVRDPSGSLYGTTLSGGLRGHGVVYKIDVSGNETVLHTFTGGLDGKTVSGPVSFDAAGNLYGGTLYGGEYGYGVLFKIDAVTHEETVIHNFTGGADGGSGVGTPLLIVPGYIYGTTLYGGEYNAGVVFRISLAPAN